MANKLSQIKDLWQFLCAQKRWALWPMIIVLLLLAVLLVLAEGSALAPFVYSLF